MKKEKPGKKDAVMKVKSFYEAQLKNFQQNAAKMEESLVNQIYQVNNISTEMIWSELFL